MVDANRYSVVIRRTTIDEDDFFEACVRELPDIRAYGASYEEAYDLALDAIESLAKIAEEKGKSFPLPIAPGEAVSGRVTLRLPKSIHAQAVSQAEIEGVSLNTYLVSAISHFVGAKEERPSHARHTTAEAQSFEDLFRKISGDASSANTMTASIYDIWKATFRQLSPLPEHFWDAPTQAVTRAYLLCTPSLSEETKPRILAIGGRKPLTKRATES